MNESNKLAWMSAARVTLRWVPLIAISSLLSAGPEVVAMGYTILPFARTTCKSGLEGADLPP